MKNLKNYLDQTMDDIVFEQRNKNYGAYDLRKNANRFLGIALSGALLLTISFSAYSLNRKVVNSIPEKNVKLDVFNFKHEVEIVKPPVVDVKKIEPAKVETAQEKLTEFIVKKEEVIIPETDIIDVTKLDNKNIGTKKITSDHIEQDPILDKEKMGGNLGSAIIDTKKTWKVVEQMPEFIGGFAKMYIWLSDHIKYPKIAADRNIEGKVYVSFVVDEEGNITETKVERGIGFGCDEAALKAVSTMPKWKPGKQQGNAVRVYFTVPIDFALAH